LKDGASPIYVAAQNGHCEVIRALLKANANAQTPKKVFVADGSEIHISF